MHISLLLKRGDCSILHLAIIKIGQWTVPCTPTHSYLVIHCTFIWWCIPVTCLYFVGGCNWLTAGMTTGDNECGEQADGRRILHNVPCFNNRISQSFESVDNIKLSLLTVDSHRSQTSDVFLYLALSFWIFFSSQWVLREITLLSLISTCSQCVRIHQKSTSFWRRK